MTSTFKSQQAAWRIFGGSESHLLPQKEGHSLEFFGNIIVGPAKRNSRKLQTVTRWSQAILLAQRCPSLPCSALQALSEIKGHQYVQFMRSPNVMPEANNCDLTVVPQIYLEISHSENNYILSNSNYRGLL